MQNPIKPFPTVCAISIIPIIVGLAMHSPPITIGLPILTVIVGGIICVKIHKENYRNSRVLKQFAKLLGFRVHNCGCVYEPNTSKYSTNIPSAEWINKEKVYERSMEGARVRFDEKKAGMKRCKQCGNHYHIVEGYSNRRNKHRRICWPEDEPDVREELNHRVIES